MATPRENRQKVLAVHPKAVAEYVPVRGYVIRYEPRGHVIASAYSRSMAWSKAAEVVGPKPITLELRTPDEDLVYA